MHETLLYACEIMAMIFICHIGDIAFGLLLPHVILLLLYALSHTPLVVILRWLCYIFVLVISYATSCCKSGTHFVHPCSLLQLSGF